MLKCTACEELISLCYLLDFRDKHVLLKEPLRMVRKIPLLKRHKEAAYILPSRGSRLKEQP